MKNFERGRAAHARLGFFWYELITHHRSRGGLGYPQE
jgi:hypothetical protein